MPGGEPQAETGGEERRLVQKKNTLELSVSRTHTHIYIYTYTHTQTDITHKQIHTIDRYTEKEGKKIEAHGKRCRERKRDVGTRAKKNHFRPLLLLLVSFQLPSSHGLHALLCSLSLSLRCKLALSSCSLCLCCFFFRFVSLLFRALHSSSSYSALLFSSFLECLRLPAPFDTVFKRDSCANQQS